MDKDDIRSRFKVILGSKPSERYMKNKLPGLFKELKNELSEVGDLRWQPLDSVKDKVREYESKYGVHLEKIHFEDQRTIDEIYEIINSSLLPRVREAKKMKCKKKENIGKEPGE